MAVLFVLPWQQSVRLLIPFFYSTTPTCDGFPRLLRMAACGRGASRDERKSSEQENLGLLLALRDDAVMPQEIRAHLPKPRVRFLQRNVCLLLPLPVLTILLLLFYSILQFYDSDPLHRVDDTLPLYLPPSLLAEKAARSSSKNFSIHIWEHGARMKRRFLRSYGKKARDPYAECSVRNCRLTTKDASYASADAVLFHLHQTKGPQTLPGRLSADQVWVFFTDESPFHTFLLTREYGMRDYNGLFNWSMTYRSDSDVPVPYGRTVRLTPAEKSEFRGGKDYAKAKSRGVAILGSNCGGRNHRWEYVRELRRHLEVDVYGGCGELKCPGHFARDCAPVGAYKFYLAFENSDCREYLTEKLWWNAYAKESVPVVMGAPRADYERLCPPGSFIHVGDYASPADLAAHLRRLMADDAAYNAYFRWKAEFKVVNEHGYFGSRSMHLCRLCEALNRRRASDRKTYGDLGSFWDSDADCVAPSWMPKKVSEES